MSLDTRLGRTVALGGGKDGPTLALSASVYDVTNHADYDLYQGVVTSPEFRHPLTAEPPRRFQFEAAFNF